MFGCLHQAIREGAPAEGASNVWNLMLMGGAGRVDADPALLAKATPFNVMSFHSGGTGGRPGKDGLSATAFPSGVKNVAVEITEAISPIVVWRKEFRIDSGGAGEFRGGLGQTMEITSNEDMPFALSATFERTENPPRGRAGGVDGLPGVVRTARGVKMRGKGHQTIAKGDRLIIEMPGGGGLGDPRRRPLDLVLQDMQSGLISKEAAARDYGLVFAGNGEVDRARTQAARGAH
jgi:N-methylhydantoinase B